MSGSSFGLTGNGFFNNLSVVGTLKVNNVENSDITDLKTEVGELNNEVTNLNNEVASLEEKVNPETHPINMETLQELKLIQENLFRIKNTPGYLNHDLDVSELIEREIQGEHASNIGEPTFNYDKSLVYYPYRHVLLCIDTQTLEIKWHKSFIDWFKDDAKNYEENNGVVTKDSLTFRYKHQTKSLEMFFSGFNLWVPSSWIGVDKSLPNIPKSKRDEKFSDIVKVFSWGKNGYIRYSPALVTVRDKDYLFFTNAEYVQNAFQHFVFVVDASGNENNGGGKLVSCIPLVFEDGEFKNKYYGREVNQAVLWGTSANTGGLQVNPTSDGGVDVFIGGTGGFQYVGGFFGIPSKVFNPESINGLQAQGYIARLRLDSNLEPVPVEQNNNTHYTALKNAMTMPHMSPEVPIQTNVKVIYTGNDLLRGFGPPRNDVDTGNPVNLIGHSTDFSTTEFTQQYHHYGTFLQYGVDPYYWNGRTAFGSSTWEVRGNMIGALPSQKSFINPNVTTSQNQNIKYNATEYGDHLTSELFRDDQKTLSKGNGIEMFVPMCPGYSLVNTDGSKLSSDADHSAPQILCYANVIQLSNPDKTVLGINNTDISGMVHNDPTYPNLEQGTNNKFLVKGAFLESLAVFSKFYHEYANYIQDPSYVGRCKLTGPPGDSPPYFSKPTEVLSAPGIYFTNYLNPHVEGDLTTSHGSRINPRTGSPYFMPTIVGLDQVPILWSMQIGNLLVTRVFDEKLGAPVPDMYHLYHVQINKDSTPVDDSIASNRTETRISGEGGTKIIGLDKYYYDCTIKDDDRLRGGRIPTFDGTNPTAAGDSYNNIKLNLKYILTPFEQIDFVASGSNAMPEISSGMLHFQEIRKYLNYSLTTSNPPYYLDASEAYRLSTGGGGLWGPKAGMVYGNELHVGIGNGYNGRYDESINICNFPTRIEINSLTPPLPYSAYYIDILKKIGKYVIWFPGSVKVDGNPLGTQLGLPFVKDEPNAPEDFLSMLKHIAVFQKVGELETERIDAIEYYNDLFNKRTQELHNKVSKPTLRQMIDCTLVVDLDEFTLKGRSSTADANDYGWTINAANLIPGANSTPSGVYPAKFYYSFVSQNSIDKVLTKFPITTDNDSHMPVKSFGDKYYSSNKSGCVYIYDAKQKTTTLTDINTSKSFDLYKTNVVPGSAIVGSNFVGDTGYAYAITDTGYLVTQSRNASETVPDFQTVETNKDNERELITVPRGKGMFVSFDLNKIGKIPLGTQIKNQGNVKFSQVSNAINCTTYGGTVKLGNDSVALITSDGNLNVYKPDTGELRTKFLEKTSGRQNLVVLQGTPDGVDKLQFLTDQALSQAFDNVGIPNRPGGNVICSYKAVTVKDTTLDATTKVQQKWEQISGSSELSI